MLLQMAKGRKQKEQMGWDEEYMVHALNKLLIFYVWLCKFYYRQAKHGLFWCFDKYAYCIACYTLLTRIRCPFFAHLCQWHNLKLLVLSCRVNLCFVCRHHLLKGWLDL